MSVLGYQKDTWPWYPSFFLDIIAHILSPVKKKHPYDTEISLS